MLENGMKAPDFTLMDQNGASVRLTDFLGKKVVLYFYPKDNTAGCTRQACAFAAEYPAFEEAGAVVIGVNRDTVKTHQGFAAKHQLPFLLLSDPEHQVLEAYGVWQEKKLYGKTSMSIVRTTYLIDENGVIVRAYQKVKPDDNAAQMLADLRA